MIYKLRFRILVLLFGFFTNSVFGQQDHTLYLMHYVPESNLLNPAVPITCKWYIGIPALSSIHFNYANSFLTYNQLFKSAPSGGYQVDLEKAYNKLHFRNYLGTELHIQLFALGYRQRDYSFMFTVTEKNNLSVTLPKQIFALVKEGNTQFEGKDVGLEGTGMFFTHYREYAISVSKQEPGGIYYGARAKLLFGKLNLASRQTNIKVHTDETTFDLHLTGDLLVHSSLPIDVSASNNQLNSIQYNDESPVALALNRKNPGFAIDAGIIYPYTDQLTLSASVVDLGLIRWRSNLNTFNGTTNYLFTGPFGSPNTGSYFYDLVNGFKDSLQLNVTYQKYTTILPPRFLAGANYTISDYFSAGAEGEAIIYRTKTLPSLTFSGQFNPARHFHLVASYSIQYRSLNNLGLGLVLGQNPVQFYILTDNALAIWPLSARNINLRFGLNINLGCGKKEKVTPSGSSSAGCFGMDKINKKKYLKKKKASW